jgi:sarcosine oxidase subunit alpha
VVCPATGKYNEGNKHFIDFQNDVTVADLELAQREGYESVEHTKRYTTFGMATDQGKTSNLNGLGVLSEATGKSIPEIGVTTFRPPYTPFSFGSIAGVLTKPLPIRRTPIYQLCGQRNLRTRRRRRNIYGLARTAASITGDACGAPGWPA